MTLQSIYDHLNAISRFDLQADWDNSGLIVGDPSQTIERIALSIDVDAQLIDAMEPGTLLITHHPLIFSPIKSLDFTRYPVNLLHQMIEKKIANIAMHTNFDQTHLNAWVAQNVLNVSIESQEEFVVYFHVNAPFDDFAAAVKSAFKLPYLKAVRGRDTVTRAALVTGSGASLLHSIDADCLLTGDVKYHDAMAAAATQISLIDIGHFESERYFPDVLAPILKNLGLTVIISSSENPFITL